MTMSFALAVILIPGQLSSVANAVRGTCQLPSPWGPGGVRYFGTFCPESLELS